MPLADEAVVRTERAGPRPRWWRNFPVRIHLALFAAGILVPLLAIVTVMLINTTRLWRDDSIHDARLIAQHLSATIEVELEKAIAVAQTLATTLVIDGGDLARFDAQARDVSSRMRVNIVTRDLTGQQLTNTYRPVGSPLPISNEGILEADRLAAERKTVVISDLRTATLRQIPTVNVVVPAIRDERIIAFVSASMTPAQFAKILATRLPDGWISGLVGRDGRLISRSVDLDRYVGTANPAFLKAATGSEGMWSGVSRDGVPITGYYIRSQLSGWIVSVGVPETILRAPAREAMLSLVGLVIASLAVSIYFGWRLSGRISAPIRDLALRARELGEGRTPAIARSSVAEVNDVTNALLAAAAELDRRAAATGEAMAAVRANEERLQVAQDTAGIGTIDWDIAADLAVCSPRFHELFALPAGAPVRFADLAERLSAEERERLERACAKLSPEGGPFEDEIRIRSANGEERWIFAKGRLDRRDGGAVRLLGACIDITERKRSEEHLRFLLRELSHRSKNLLAVIQAMASQTAKSAESVDIFRRRFGERLMGLAASHDLLVNQNWLGASVERLARGQLAPFVEARDPRVQVHGPAVDLKAEAVEALGLALHELATNSLKYGALSDPSGKVEISWEVVEAEGRRFHMEWIERTALPVAPPNHKGFGRMVIEHTVEATFNGRVTLAFPPEGLRWRLDAPATCLAVPSEVAAD